MTVWAMAVAVAASSSRLYTGPAGHPVRQQARQKKSGGRNQEKSGDKNQEPNWVITTANDKLARLVATGFTSAEIAIATGSSLRAIEDRRRRIKEGAAKESPRSNRLNTRIDALFSIVSLLEQHRIEIENIRAWLLGRSMYLQDQRPAVLLSASEFELVREAAIAYATGDTPAEFLNGRDPLPRPAEPAEV
jgi:hypothetical protein